MYNEYLKRVKGCASNNYARKKKGTHWGCTRQTGTLPRDVKSMIQDFKGGKERELFTRF